MAEYLRLFPILVEVLAAFALLFCLIAYLALRWRGPAGVWIVWAVYAPSVTGGCVLALSGVRYGTATVAPILYYIALAVVSIGFPLAVSARVMTVLASRKPAVSPIVGLLGPWAAAVAMSPVALLLIAATDSLYALTK